MTADATRLGGSAASSYVSRIRRVRVASASDGHRVKGPLRARCPAGTQVVSGGAAVEGAVRGVALAQSTPAGRRGWVAVADRRGRWTAPWRLVMRAICVAGGS